MKRTKSWVLGCHPDDEHAALAALKSDGSTIVVEHDAAKARGTATLTLAFTGHKRDFDVTTGEWR